jgi:syntaxin 1B/2/3
VGSSSERTRTAITAALKKKLKDIMGEFSALRQKLQLEYRCAPSIIKFFHTQTLP